jgi:hypothetical protein
MSTPAEDTPEPAGGPLRDIFARSVVDDDVTADVFPEFDPDELHALVGKRVTAKRLGWDDGPEAEDDPDHTPYSEMEYASPDLSGVLSEIRFKLPDGTPGIGWEVGGQPADPATVRPADTTS